MIAQGDQKCQRQSGNGRDHEYPEAFGGFLQSDRKGFDGFVRFFIRHQADQRGYHKRDDRGRIEAAVELGDVEAVERLHGDQHHHQRQHVEPSGVVDAVQALKDAV